ncbi:hypothetical protein, partial [Actinoalloteichus caeruleus]|uniref:hypothetical protein n=1 Tax=Actinoalloteichus cyanogriseus TaxID=2893586 RepID=UPI001B80D908
PMDRQDLQRGQPAVGVNAGVAEGDAGACHQRASREEERPGQRARYRGLVAFPQRELRQTMCCAAVTGGPSQCLQQSRRGMVTAQGAMPSHR